MGAKIWFSENLHVRRFLRIERHNDTNLSFSEIYLCQVFVKIFSEQMILPLKNYHNILIGKMQFFLVKNRLEIGNFYEIKLMNWKHILIESRIYILFSMHILYTEKQGFFYNLWPIINVMILFNSPFLIWR